MYFFAGDIKQHYKNILSGEEMQNRIRELNCDKGNDKFEYPKNSNNYYTAWEMNNLIELIIKTESYRNVVID